MTTAWLQPATLDEALALRREHGDDALVVAGGTFVGILLSTGLLMPPPAFLALRDVAGLGDVRVDEDGTLVLGALATHRQVETHPEVLAGWPVLAACLRLVANERVRNQATIGGVLADADYASDPPALLSVLGAEAVLAGPEGRRAVPVSELIVDHYTTLLTAEELLVEVRGRRRRRSPCTASSARGTPRTARASAWPWPHGARPTAAWPACAWPWARSAGGPWSCPRPARWPRARP